ncbi:primosomal protein [Rarobacter incanus]|uniref:Primosomal protein n=1 Tax=Rarobacter incanus TaxID=153494 RepID=A0A542SMB1_9MICO|nr:primosomal protein [Rarobacter incanus]TQK75764.1 hypothetical protein FB389_0398 [Rarobacter incanus]
MTVDPRAALDRLIAAFEAHYNAVAARRGDNDQSVDNAYYVLADAFDVYDEALGMVYGEATPFILDEDEDEESDDPRPRDDGARGRESDSPHDF